VSVKRWREAGLGCGDEAGWDAEAGWQGIWNRGKFEELAVGMRLGAAAGCMAGRWWWWWWWWCTLEKLGRCRYGRVYGVAYTSKWEQRKQQQPPLNRYSSWLITTACFLASPTYPLSLRCALRSWLVQR
jgi:hypothetical protein